MQAGIQAAEIQALDALIYGFRMYQISFDHVPGAVYTICTSAISILLDVVPWLLSLKISAPLAFNLPIVKAIFDPSKECKCIRVRTWR